MYAATDKLIDWLRFNAYLEVLPSNIPSGSTFPATFSAEHTYGIHTCKLNHCQ